MISHPIKFTPTIQDTDLIGLANVDGIGWDRIGSRVEVYHYHNHSYEYLRVTSFKVLSIAVYFALFTVQLYFQEFLLLLF